MEGLVADDPVAEPVGDIADEPSWVAPESTGIAAVDDAVASVRELDGMATGEHVAGYERVHRQLQDALADLDGA